MGKPKPSSEIMDAKWFSSKEIEEFGSHTKKIIRDLKTEKLLS